MTIRPLVFDPIARDHAQRVFRHHLDRLSRRPDGWAIDDDNRPALGQVCDWIAAGDYRLGPMLIGPVGTGKSTIIEAAGSATNELHRRGLRTIDAVELASACCGKDGRAALKIYADFERYPMLIIEDLLLEKNAPSFLPGDDGINAVAELVQLRYKNWQRGFPLCTGFTHNATDEQLLARYGERCVSRMSHMVYLAKVGGRDRRREAPLPAAPAQLPQPRLFEDTSSVNADASDARVHALVASAATELDGMNQHRLTVERKTEAA